MSAADDNPSEPSPPVSRLDGSASELIKAGVMSAPVRPGLLGSLGRFEILHLIGAGGMGVVFLARDSSTEQRVAVKLLRPELLEDERAVQYFLNEARHMQRLGHPHALPAVEICTDKARPYFVMPLIEPGSLAKRMQPGVPLKDDFVLAVAVQIAAALQHAHRKGIIHRDIKPTNVLVDANGHAWLSDFGLARSLLNPALLDQEGVHLEGTTPYLSPQSVRGEVEDTRGDIYAFGALLYEMLTGHVPYRGATSQEVLDHIRQGPPRPIMNVNAKTSPALAGISRDAMARELRERYASMSDVIADLERAKGGDAICGARGRGWFNTARRLVPAVGAGLMVILLAVGIWRFWPRHRLLELRHFSSPAVLDWQLAKLGHWQDKDTASLFVNDGTGSQLLVFSLAGDLLANYHVVGTNAQGFEVDLLADVWTPDTNPKNGLDEAFISWTESETNLHLAILNQNREPIWRFSSTGAVPSLRGSERDVTHLRSRLVTDLDSDGKRELLALINTGYSGQPRGLYCIDFDSQSVRWQHLIGPGVLQLALFRFDPEGRQGVLLGTAAVSNGVKAADGSDDLHAYLYAFGPLGDMLWRIQLGDTYTSAHPLVADLDGDSRQELLAWVTAPAEFRTNEVGRIVQLDRATGMPLPGREYDAHASLLGCMAADLDGKGKTQIIATDNRGIIHILDENLRCVGRTTVVAQNTELAGPLRDLNFVDLQLVAITNLDNHPDNEIILRASQIQVVQGQNPGLANGEGNVRHAHDLTVYILNHQLKTLATYKVAQIWENASGWSVSVARRGTNLSPEILVFAKDQVRVLKYD